MSDSIILGTRKGLLILERKGSDWKLSCEAHRAMPVSYAATDARTGLLWAGLDHGHWGQKLHRSRDMGATWEEIEAPKYPEGATRPPEDKDPASTTYIWMIQPGGTDEPHRLYVGGAPQRSRRHHLRRAPRRVPAHLGRDREEESQGRLSNVG